MFRPLVAIIRFLYQLKGVYISVHAQHTDVISSTNITITNSVTVILKYGTQHIYFYVQIRMIDST